MRVYYGLFGRRRGLRPYAGLWAPFLGGAIGLGRRGFWFKFSGRRVLSDYRRYRRRGW